MKSRSSSVGRDTMNLIGLIQQRPYRIDNLRCVGVDDQIPGFIMMTRYMHIDNALGGHGTDEFDRIVAVVHAVDVDVVDVEMQVAVRFRQHGPNKFNFAHIGNRSLHVERDIFQGDAPLQNILGAPNPRGNIFYCFFGERHREQIIEVATVVRTIGKMFGI